MGAVPEPRSHRARHRGHGLRRAPRRLVRVIATVTGAATLALAAVACGGGTPSATSPGGTRTLGGTATYALPPSTTPNYIFPFASSTYFSVANAQYFQYLMYRPLYWFGTGTSPTLNPSRSLATPPTYNGRQITITMKDWKWSNGETVTAKDALFWVHMMQAVAATDWGAYVPGGFPTNVSNVKATSDTQLTMTMNKDYNHTWFTSNELSQITPMPKAWDRTGSGASDCTATVSDCPAVYSYLDSQSKNMSGYTSSHLWSVVDGPWRLESFSPDGNSTFVPNKAYSGPVKPSLDKFQEIPFTTESAQYNVLQAHGSGGQTLDVGYLPTTDAPAKPAGATVGANPVSGYTLDPLYLWSINYFPLNMQSTTGNGPVLRQLYFRQALAYLMNQRAVIQGPLRGYGLYTVGPVGSYPPTSYLSPKGKQGDPFPYNSAKAKQLLTSHGWNVAPGGNTTCADPAKCGSGINRGHSLSFTLPYATGTSWIASEMTQLQSNASQLGIRINLEPKPFNQVTAIGAGNCAVAHTSCDWDMANWGGGWSFAPDYYPTGETLFLSGSGANSGGYTDSHNDTLINQTLSTNSTTPLYQWQDYLSQQVPVLWQPNGVYQLTQVINNLHGVIPQSTTGAINPENWYFTKLWGPDMIGFFIRRILQAAIVVLLVTMITFILLRAIPGNVAVAILGPAAYRNPEVLARFNAQYGFNRPWWSQYLLWLGHLLQGNLGFSWNRDQSVASLLGQYLPKTIILVGISTILALIIAVPVGLWQAVRRNKAVDYLFTALSFLFYAAPTFFVGTVLILVFAVNLRMFGAEGPQGGVWNDLTDWRDLTLPVITLALVTIALFSRYMRSAVLDNITEDYVRTARAKGAGRGRVLWRHVMRNSLIPIATLLGLSIPGIMSGALITESVFNYPGMGYLFYQSAQKQDYPTLLGFIIVVAIATVIGSLLADLAYAVLDPRVRYTH